MLCAATHGLPAAAKTSQGVLPGGAPDEPELLEPLEDPAPELDDPEPLEEPELPDPLEEALPEPDDPEPLDEAEPPELLAVPLPVPLGAPELPLLLPPGLPEDWSEPLEEPEPEDDEKAPELSEPAENDPHATAMAPSDAATDAATKERGFFIATSPSA